MGKAAAKGVGDAGSVMDTRTPLGCEVRVVSATSSGVSWKPSGQGVMVGVAARGGCTLP